MAGREHMVSRTWSSRCLRSLELALAGRARSARQAADPPRASSKQIRNEISGLTAISLGPKYIVTLWGASRASLLSAARADDED